MLGCQLVKHDSKRERVSRNLYTCRVEYAVPILTVTYCLLPSLPSLLPSLVWFSPPLFSPVLITKVDLCQLEHIYIYIDVHMTVLSGQTLMVTSVTFYYYPPHLSTLTSVRGLTTPSPASSPVRVQKTVRL